MSDPIPIPDPDAELERKAAAFAETLSDEVVSNAIEKVKANLRDAYENRRIAKTVLATHSPNYRDLHHPYRRALDTTRREAKRIREGEIYLRVYERRLEARPSRRPPRRRIPMPRPRPSSKTASDKQRCDRASTAGTGDPTATLVALSKVGGEASDSYDTDQPSQFH